jgi:RHS repeat-associated protein
MNPCTDAAEKDWNYAWTIKNQLKQATVTGDDVTFTYDADGMMILRNDNGQQTVHPSTRLRAGVDKLYQHELFGSNIQTKHYLFGGKLVAMRVNSTVSFFLTDHLGSVAATLYANGNLRSSLRYDPWGKLRWSQNVDPNGYRYTGQRWDDGLGLYDYNARYYDPHIGRFISADVIVPGTSRLTPLTIGFHETMFLEQANGENQQLQQLGPIFTWNNQQKQKLGTSAGPPSPQTLNRFAYVANNPLRYSDPTGHELEEIGTVTITLEELEDLIIDLNNLQLQNKIFGLVLTLAAILVAAIPPLAFLIAAVGVIYIIDGEQLSNLTGYLENSLRLAESEGLEYVDITVSNVFEDEDGFWHNNSIAITTNVSNSIFFLSLFTPSAHFWRDAAKNW